MEHNIQLFVSSVAALQTVHQSRTRLVIISKTYLWQPEEGPNQSTESCCKPEICCLALQICFRRIDQIWFDNVGDDLCYVINVS